MQLKIGSMKRLFRYLSVILVLSSVVSKAQVAADSASLKPEKNGVLGGQIQDRAGATIQAFVLVHSDRGNKIDKQVPVDKEGEFKIELAAGLYDFFVASPGFLPIAKVIEIKGGRQTTLKLTMKVDEEHLQDDVF